MIVSTLAWFSLRQLQTDRSLPFVTLVFHRAPYPGIAINGDQFFALGTNFSQYLPPLHLGGDFSAASMCDLRWPAACVGPGWLLCGLAAGDYILGMVLREFGPTIPAVLICLLGATFGFIPKFGAFSALNLASWVGILVLLAAAVLVVVMGHWRHHENERLLRAQDELEDRVRERTADLDVVNRNLRELSARLMQLQDDERRRIARELHDSVGQTLAALGMNLSLVRNDVERM